MAKPDVKCGLTVVDRLTRIRITSVAGLAIPADDQPFVIENERGGFYASMHETGYVPADSEITTISRATAEARVLACNLLEHRIAEARRVAQADLDQGELPFDGVDVEAECDGAPAEALALPQAGRATPPGEVTVHGCDAIPLGDSDNVIEGDFRIDGPDDGDEEIECQCGRLFLRRDGVEIPGKTAPLCCECGEAAEELEAAGVM